MDTILIKISGELFAKSTNKEKASSLDGAFSVNKKLIENICQQIKTVQQGFNIGIVIGGGNIWRGDVNGKQLNLTEQSSHQIGMISTIINGIVLQNFLENSKIKTTHFSSFCCPQITRTIRQDKIKNALQKNECLIFSGGTGNPYFTTDTTAILRALQIDAKLILKATKVDGVYDSDPATNKNAKILKKISYEEMIKNNLKVMDLTAITLAKQHNLKIKVFNLFEEDSIIKVIQDKNFGSTVS